MFNKPMHRTIDIHNVSKIEYVILKTEADMNLYEIYFINLWKPPLNIDDKARDDLTIILPDLEWVEFVPSKWEDWKRQLKSGDMYGWHKMRNDRIMEDFQW
jgi:excinuclease UvrABC nuclease subunit